ncbi:MAG: hypothetical protein O8C65_15060 [Candidatus Methanoperedens sp.]|nr:hypothetical protein [Candidatus Methanoperedens sp.]
MSIEFTGINKETAAGEIKSFLDSCPDDTMFKMVINSKRGNLRIKVRSAKKSRLKKIFGRFRRKKSNV